MADPTAQEIFDSFPLCIRMSILANAELGRILSPEGAAALLDAHEKHDSPGDCIDAITM